MKKQSNTGNSLSVKSKITVAILCAMIGTTEINAKNYPSTNPNRVSRETRSDNKTENGSNSISSINISDYSEIAAAEEVSSVMEQWMIDHSYWSLDDIYLNEQKNSKNLRESEKNKNCSTNEVIDSNLFIFNAESYITNSEF